jgi:hypothetical protein
LLLDGVEGELSGSGEFQVGESSTVGEYSTDNGAPNHFGIQGCGPGNRIPWEHPIGKNVMYCDFNHV